MFIDIFSIQQNTWLYINTFITITINHPFAFLIAIIIKKVNSYDSCSLSSYVHTNTFLLYR